MSDLETSCVRCDPINHVAAIRAPGRGHAVCIDVGIISDDVVDALHQVFIDAPAPIVGDLVREFLSIARRAARINHDGDVSRRGKQLFVPPVAPRIGPQALRPAMNEEEQGIFFRRVEMRRANQHPLNCARPPRLRTRTTRADSCRWTRGARHCARRVAGRCCHRRVR